MKITVIIHKSKNDFKIISKKEFLYVSFITNTLKDIGLLLPHAIKAYKKAEKIKKI